METNENSELSGENLKLPKTIFQKLSFFYKNLNKFWFSMVALVLIGYSFNDYFARDIGPETIEKGKFLIADVKDCFNLDEIHPYVILDGRKPEGASMKMTVTKNFIKEDYSTEYTELKDGIVNFKLCKSSSDLVVFHTNVAGYPEVFENRYSPNAIPDTIFLTPQ